MNSQNTNKTNSLSRNATLILFAKVTSFALAFVLPLLIVRWLDKSEVGVYRQIFQVITNVVMILPFGFSMSAFYFLNREPEKRAPAIFNILLFNFVTGGLACLALFLFPQILGSVFRSVEITRLAPAAGVVIWLWMFSAFLETVTMANQESRLATVFIIHGRSLSVCGDGADGFADDCVVRLSSSTFSAILEKLRRAFFPRADVLRAAVRLGGRALDFADRYS
jgi:O-antigen/teichoic acid export membrane protein